MLNKQKLGTFVLGGLAGALAGILLAPRSGKEIRGAMASRAGEARERGRESYFEARERARERAAEVRDAPAVREEELDLTVGPASEPEPPPVFPSAAPPLRDVSGEDAVEVESQPEGDPEELRRRIQETRSRLRSRLGKPGDEPEKTDG